MKGNTLNRKRAGDFPGFQVLESQCIWMKAGVINFRACDHDYDCFTCPFDKAMRSAMDAQNAPKGRDRSVGWADEMRKKYTGPYKPCPYFVSGEIGPPGICERNYDCESCPIELELGYKAVQQSIEAARLAKDSIGLERRGEPRRLPGFRAANNECIWMRAGIVGFRPCDNEYDCYHCEFDRSMREAMVEKPHNGKPGQPEVVRETPEAVITPCIHYLAGRPEAPAECSMNYECYRCGVHIAISGEMEFQPRAVDKPAYRSVAGHRLAEGYYYHFGHSWVHIIHGECVRVGVDSFVSSVFGKVDGLEIPEPGTDLKKARVGWVLSREGHRAPVLCPLTGRVLAANQKVLRAPETLCKDPYGDGWLFQLEPSFLKREAQGLYSGKESFRWMEHENQRLLELLGPNYERLSATGGEAMTDLFGHFPEIGWEPLVRTFLWTKSLGR
jgi:glycine cleavage system H lipoate-binding protein